MAGDVVEYADNRSLVEELVVRETFPGIVVFKDGYRNNQCHGLADSPSNVIVEISTGVTNKDAAEMLREVQKVLSQLVISR